MTEPSEHGTMWLLKILKGGIVTNPEMALKIAELVIANVYSADDLEQQRPLTVSDQSDRWLVEGSYNKDRKIEGWGAAKVVIKKSDGQILEVYIPMVMLPHPDVHKYLRSDKSKS